MRQSAHIRHSVIAGSFLSEGASARLHLQKGMKTIFIEGRHRLMNEEKINIPQNEAGEAPYIIEMRNITKVFPGIVANDDRRGGR